VTSKPKYRKRSVGSTKFETKIFFCIFAASVSLCSVVAFSCYVMMSRLVETEFFNRYLSVANSLGTTVTEFEKNSELNMKTGALYLKQIDDAQGEISTKKLREYAGLLNLTHIFIIDKTGKFVKSTNENPNLIPNLFSFCSDYRSLISGHESMQATPIIPPDPEPKPYKFLTITNQARNRMIHVGLRVDFIDEMLKRTIAKDDNLLRLELSSPDGTSLGSFGKAKFDYVRKTDSNLSKAENGVTKISEGYVFSKWIDSAHVICCQCEKAGNVRKGRYECLVRAVVSNSSLISAQSTIYRWMLLIFSVACLIAALTARLLTNQLVKRLTKLNNQVRELSDETGRVLNVDVHGSDEITELSESFNDLLQRHFLAQQNLLEVERGKAMSETATRVAHDIRSPLSAINMVLASLKDLPNEKMKVLLDAASRVNQIADDLLTKHKDRMGVKPSTGLISLNAFVSRIYGELDVRLESFPQIKLKYVQSKGGEIYCRADETLLYRAVNNCLNNAIEAMPTGGHLTLGLQLEGRSAALVIIDTGIGISAELLKKLGVEKVSVGKENSRSGAGIGVFTAKEYVESMGGQLVIQSREGEGTMVSIRFVNEIQPIVN
jgi:signal transduction histidine kinase